MEIVSIIIALWALFVSLLDSRRNNRVTLKLVDLTSCYKMTIQNRNGYHLLTVRFRNLGISLHDVEVLIRFTESRGYGTKMIHLTTHTQGNIWKGEFARGMIAEYKLEYNGHDRCLLDELENPRKQRAEIVVFSQGYEAYSFPVCRFTDPIKKVWNRVPYWINSKTEIKEVVDGRECIRYWIDLPRFIDREYRVTWFADAIRRSKDRQSDVRSHQ